MDGPVGREAVAEGQAALRAGDAAGARRAFGSAVVDPVSGDVIEGLARASYLELDFAPAIEGWERAYAAHRASRDRIGAVRVARTLAYMYGSIVGDGAVMGGWLARAQTLLDGDTTSPEAGWVALNSRHVRERPHRGARRGSETRSRSLDGLATATSSSSRSPTSAPASSTPTAPRRAWCSSTRRWRRWPAARSTTSACSQEIFCQLFAACEHAHDVARADQWIRVGEAIAARRQLPAVSAFCRTHYGGVLTAAGRWPEADVALTEAVRLWGLGHRSLRGGALVRLADLRVRQGRFEEAEQLLDGLDGDVEAARPLAAIHLAAGETALADDVLERALAEIDPHEHGGGAAARRCSSTSTSPPAGSTRPRAPPCDARRVRRAARRATTCAAAAALARGRVCLAAGTGDPQACLREALAGFARAQMPMEVGPRPARARRRARRPTAPRWRWPRPAPRSTAFERLQAARHADAAAAVLRSLGVRTAAGAQAAAGC